MRESFVFYKSFFDAICDLNDKKRLKMFDAIANLALKNEENIKLSKDLERLFILIKPQILANNKRYEDGCKGGRPKKEKTSGFSEKKPNENENVNVNENANVNVNDKDFYGEYANVYLDKNQYGKLLSICASKKLLDSLIATFSSNIEQGKENKYNTNLPNAHYERLLRYLDYRRKNPEKFLIETKKSIADDTLDFMRKLELRETANG